MHIVAQYEVQAAIITLAQLLDQYHLESLIYDLQDLETKGE